MGGRPFGQAEAIADLESVVETSKNGGVGMMSAAPLMHGAAQWGFLRFAFEGNLVVMLSKFDAQEVWRTVERERINTVAITGDAMARPMIDAVAINSSSNARDTRPDTA